MSLARRTTILRWIRRLHRYCGLAMLPWVLLYAVSGFLWIHALIVDLTIMCLVLWCMTGLVMWWQLRRLRRIGWVVMLSGLVASVWLLVLVWPSMTG